MTIIYVTGMTPYDGGKDTSINVSVARKCQVYAVLFVVECLTSTREPTHMNLSNSATLPAFTYRMKNTCNSE